MGQCDRDAHREAVITPFSRGALTWVRPWRNHFHPTRLTMLNQDVISQKKLVESVFDTVAEGYGTLEYVRHFGQRLVHRAGLRKGMKVLDVACGRGAVLIPAAEAVGRGGLTVGIDLAVEMIDQTYVEVRQRDLDQAIMFHMDAEALDFDSDTFDVVLCGFGLFFFPHLEKALAEFMRVLKPG